MNRTIITRTELAQRWGKSLTTIDDYEREGYIRRVKLGGANFSLAAIEAIENEGMDNLILKKSREIEELKLALAEKNDLIRRMKNLLDNY